MWWGRGRGGKSPAPGVWECHGRAEVLARTDGRAGRWTVCDVLIPSERGAGEVLLILSVLLENHVSSFSGIRVFDLQVKHIPVTRQLQRPQTMRTAHHACSVRTATFPSASLPGSGKPRLCPHTPFLSPAGRRGPRI